MKKRSFLLLELLIAFALISLFAFPLIFNPMLKLNEELLLLEKMECERLSEFLFAEIKERLYQNEIPLKKIPASKPKKPNIERKKEKYFTIYLGDFKTPRTIHFDIFLYWMKGPEKDKNGRKIGLLAIDFVHRSDEFSHRAFIYAYPTHGDQ